jgi:hypothetical protein
MHKQVNSSLFYFLIILIRNVKIHDTISFLVIGCPVGEDEVTNCIEEFNCGGSLSSCRILISATGDNIICKCQAGKRRYNGDCVEISACPNGGN